MGICSVNECNNKSHCKGYCERHYRQMLRYGKIIISGNRSNKDPNEFIIDGEICWVILYNQKGIEVARAKFDTKYYEDLKDYKWFLDKDGYAKTTLFGEDDLLHQGFLHQAIFQLSGRILQSEEEIDHKDRDKLNNFDDNLRVCTHAQNAQNREISIKNTSGWKGVGYDKRRKKLSAKIWVNDKPIPLGLFSTKEDAARAYNVAAIKYFGEFAVLNKIENGGEVESEHQISL